MQPPYTSQPISTACISNQDIMSICLCVKNLIMADVTELISERIAPLKIEINELRSENAELKVDI